MIELSTAVIDNSIFITWEAPFTLNITNTEPDITYCIHISHDNHDSESVHNITAAEFLYNVTHQSYCSDNGINITVIPFNAAGYGAPTAVKFHCNAVTSMHCAAIQCHYHCYNADDKFEILPEIIQTTTETMELRLHANSV